MRDHAASCSQCLDATQQFDEAHGDLAFLMGEEWLDMLDTLHDWN